MPLFQSVGVARGEAPQPIVLGRRGRREGDGGGDKAHVVEDAADLAGRMLRAREDLRAKGFERLDELLGVARVVAIRTDQDPEKAQE